MAERITTGTDNSFFGRIGASVTDVFSVALPVWTSQQLRDQSGDQLSNPLFNQLTAPPRADAGAAGAETTGDARNAPLQRASFVQFGGTSIGGLTVALGLAGLLAVFLLLRK